MAAGKEIRGKIKSVENTKKITKAMEMVAASKMRKAQDRMRSARPYSDKIRNITANLSRANPEYKSPYMRADGKSGVDGFVVVTTDKVYENQEWAWAYREQDRLGGHDPYSASKAAVNVYMDGLRMHLLGTGVRATTICPGFIKTPMTAGNTFHMPQLMEADYAARKMIRAIARGTKVYNFPWRLYTLIRFSRWLPDWVMVRVMGDYEADAQAAVAARQRTEPPGP